MDLLSSHNLLNSYAKLLTNLPLDPKGLSILISNLNVISKKYLLSNSVCDKHYNALFI